MPKTDAEIRALMAPFRAEIDALDERLVELLAERFAIIRRVAAFKSEQGIPAILDDRVQQVKDRVAARAAATPTFDPEIAIRLWTILIDESCALEARLGATAQAK
jgi:4-amino-4-deoxychorismate mutase